MKRFIECAEAKSGRRTLINMDKIETINELDDGTVVTFNSVNGKFGYITLKDRYDDLLEKNEEGDTKCLTGWLLWGGLRLTPN